MELLRPHVTKLSAACRLMDTWPSASLIWRTNVSGCETPQKSGKKKLWTSSGAGGGSAGRSIPRFYGGRSAKVMHVLPEHLGGDERDAALRHEEAPLAVLVGIEADLQSRGKRAIAVHHAVAQFDVAVHLDVGQDHRVLDIAVAVHVHVGEQQRAPHARSADDAA